VSQVILGRPQVWLKFLFEVGVATPSAATPALSDCAGPAVTSWDFGDGTLPAAGQDPTHAYGSAGTFLWQVTTTASGSCCGRSGIVRAEMPPIAAIRRHLRR
jgi:hypothetical protein